MAEADDLSPLTTLADDVLRRVVRACVNVMDPSQLASIGVTCHQMQEMCRPQLAELRERRAAAPCLNCAER